MPIEPVIAIGAALSLSACMQAGVPSTPVTAQQASGARMNAQADDLSLSCTELSTRDARIRNRISEIEAESRARQASNVATDLLATAVLGGVMGAGAQRWDFRDTDRRCDGTRCRSRKIGRRRS